MDKWTIPSIRVFLLLLLVDCLLSSSCLALSGFSILIASVVPICNVQFGAKCRVNVIRAKTLMMANAQINNQLNLIAGDLSKWWHTAIVWWMNLFLPVDQSRLRLEQEAICFE